MLKRCKDNTIKILKKDNTLGFKKQLAKDAGKYIQANVCKNYNVIHVEKIITLTNVLKKLSKKRKVM